MNKAEEIQQPIRILGFAARQAADDWVRSSGLTRQQAFTLGYIERQQDRGVMAREIAEMSGTTAASVASLIQGLEDRGYLTRDPVPEGLTGQAAPRHPGRRPTGGRLRRSDAGRPGTPARPAQP